GNAAFKAGDYPGAVGHYTAAILADSADPTFPLNRAAAYLKLNKNEDAERDCSTVLKLQANNVKAMFRRAQARVALGKLSGARAGKLEQFNQPNTTPPTLVAFLQQWTNAESAGARTAVLFTVPPDSIPALFGPTLESPLLGAMLAALAWGVSPASTSVSTSIPQRALEYMRALSRVPRFTTLVMFLDTSEKQFAKAVWDGIAQGGEVDIEGERTKWGC
ncbi:TPR-like protein, partial [Ceratobasidium sp. AG-I]